MGMQVQFAKISTLERLLYICFSLSNNIDPDNMGFVLRRTKLLKINNDAFNSNFGFQINGVFALTAMSNINYTATDFQASACIPGFMQTSSSTIYSDLQNSLYNNGALHSGRLTMLTISAILYN